MMPFHRFVSTISEYDMQKLYDEAFEISALSGDYDPTAHCRGSMNVTFEILSRYHSWLVEQLQEDDFIGHP